ncbi:MAG: CNNM domain-containing protein [Bacteroidales bacterium]
MEILLLYLFIALGFSFLCSMLESVILSITPSYVNMLQESGSKAGKLLAKFKSNIDRPLAAILTLNTFAHTIGAAGVGAQAQVIWGNEYLSIVSAVLTILILIISEIIPKTIGAMFNKQLAGFAAYSLQVMIYSPVYPFIIISQWITYWLKRGRINKEVSRDELSAMARVGANIGEVHEKESRIIQNLMKINYLRVKDIMTPRVVIVSADEESCAEEFYDQVQNLRFSRIPVYKEDQEHITGYILKDELLVNLLHDQQDKKLKEFKREIPIVVSNAKISDLYEKLTEENDMIALVVDEYGGLDGIVTMEDIVETILGLEIVDEYDTTRDMQLLAKDLWKKKLQKNPPKK